MEEADPVGVRGAGQSGGERADGVEWSGGWDLSEPVSFTHGSFSFTP